MRNGDRDARVAPVPHGRGYRVDSPPGHALVRPELAAELARLFEIFAERAGFTAEKPVGIYFKPGIFGHHKEDRAADIYAVAGIGLDEWKRRYDVAKERAARTADPEQRKLILARARRENRGWQLYKTLQTFGRWSQPYGYPIQLFGPWTREEGPWKYISNFLLHAHRDHIHVAR